MLFKNLVFRPQTFMSWEIAEFKSSLFMGLRYFHVAKSEVWVANQKKISSID